MLFGRSGVVVVVMTVRELNGLRKRRWRRMELLGLGRVGREEGEGRRSVGVVVRGVEIVFHVGFDFFHYFEEK